MEQAGHGKGTVQQAGLTSSQTRVHCPAFWDLCWWSQTALLQTPPLWGPHPPPERSASFPSLLQSCISPKMTTTLCIPYAYGPHIQLNTEFALCLHEVIVRFIDFGCTFISSRYHVNRTPERMLAHRFNCTLESRLPMTNPHRIMLTCCTCSCWQAPQISGCRYQVEHSAYMRVSIYASCNILLLARYVYMPITLLSCWKECLILACLVYLPGSNSLSICF